MNRNKLKAYAPQARREFIEAVTARASHYGLTAKKTEPMTERGDVVLIAGRAFPKAVGQKRKKLEGRIQRQGFDQTMEAMAYTWFNRLVAIRFMELHGYLDHGYRVLSPTSCGNGQAEGGVPEIIEHAEHVDLPGLNRQKVIELKLDGTKEEELYRLLLLAQCNALHKAMPFLFESIDDETELLLPDHLLHSDSLIRRLVAGIPEEDWQAVEIIGWLYQFYISERKDEVIGKVVKSEDIPAATQLFTPNWIVKYLVQNSLGRQWVATYPTSTLKGRMDYYIEPAEQTSEVQAKLAEITPKSLNPEELTLLDPACGSGHILVEAYDLLKAIYQERGYRAKDIPRLILEKNLYGLEIDDRAAQLAAFALMMKARADDRGIFERAIQPHVLSIQESNGQDAREITEALNQPILKEEPPPSGELFEEIADARSPLFSRKNLSVKGGISQADVAHLIALFEHGKTFGSLIRVPESLAERLPVIARRVDDVIAHGGMFEKTAATALRPFVAQARILAQRHDVVAANPPYMGGRWMNPVVKAHAKEEFPDAYADLFAAFISRGLEMLKTNGRSGMVTMQSWMFLSSFEDLRHRLLASHSLESMAHLGPRAFSTISGEVVTVTAFVWHLHSDPAFVPTFLRLTKGEEEEKIASFHDPALAFRHSPQRNFLRIPGYPLAYWVSDRWVKAFETEQSLGDVAHPRQGLATGSNDRFVRCWWEPAIDCISFSCGDADAAITSGCKWFPYNKGGEYRKWFGNNVHVVNWEDDGREIRSFTDAAGKLRSRPQNTQYYFRPSLTWSFVSSTSFAVRCCDKGFIFDIGGSSLFPPAHLYKAVAGYLCSKVAYKLMQLMNPTLNFQVGNVASLPLPLDRFDEVKRIIERNVDTAVAVSRDDWDTRETSWSFRGHVFCHSPGASTLPECAARWRQTAEERYEAMRVAENEINLALIRAFALDGEIDSAIGDNEITLHRPDQEDDIKRLISYAIGCMMGRYSLDEPGLIFAYSGNQGFDSSKYRTFVADEDGIIPLTDFNWFADDTASRFEKFVATASPAEHLEENLRFVADSLGPKNGESPRGTIRRYLAADFFKHHLSMYKKRPIYWLFSSGKQRGFQALVYLHRYNEGTLARMRTEYVIPLLGKMTARIAHLTDDSAAATSSQHKKRLENEKATITKQLAEIQAFDEKLRHYADQRIKLDLDDGVKVNYGKFGDLLAEAKAITGGSSDE